MKNPIQNRTRVPETLERSILDTLESVLDAAMTTLIEIYPFPAEILISTGEYTALHAHSDSVATQIRTLSEVLRLYRQCLEELPEEPPKEPPMDHPTLEEIPF